MRRLFAALTLVGFLAALPLTHLALGAPKGPKKGPKTPQKVLVCHIDDVDYTVDANGNITVTDFTAHVISVASKAVNAHLAHGDAVVPPDANGNPQFAAHQDCTALGAPPLNPVLKAQSELESD